MAETAREIGSLPVANVQALAEALNNGGDVQVPERYLSKDPAAEEVIAADDSAHAIPVIDLQRLLDLESSEEECAKLGSACHHWGFFQLINHGVPDKVIGRLKNDIVEFLKQPLEAKKECSQHAGSIEGYGQAFVMSEDQKLDWADSSTFRFILVSPGTCASGLLALHPSDAYSSEMRALGYRLLELMAKAVGAEPALLLGVFQEQPQGMRVNHYPPCRQAADRVLGLSPHTDACGLTLLLQLDNNDGADGLQINKDGKWFTVNVVDGAFVVNVGDVLEIMSNGKFTSVEHRAVVHPSKGRVSVALFLYPCPNMMVSPLPEFMKKGDKERYRSTSYADFVKQYFATKLDGRKHIERLMLEQ